MSEPKAERQVGVFGGSFNPPHVAHVLSCVVATDWHALDEILVIPAFVHPFAKELVDYPHRVRMCELAMAHLPHVTISRIEEELGGESRTLWTLEHLRAMHPAWKLRLVIGADVLVDSAKWYRFDEVTKLAPPIVLGRVGVEHEGAPLAVLPDVSSTQVRAWFRTKDPRLTTAVPPSALAYAKQHRLYA
jgi:nicotinate-nucleotide adenylyltransferase